MPITARPGRPILRWLPRVILLALAVVVIVALLGLAAALAPDFAGDRSIPVDSTGLQPAIPQGAMLVEQPVTPTALHAGDVVSFGSNENPGVVFTMQVVSWRIAPAPASGLVELHTRPITGGEERLWLVPATEPVGRMLYWVPWAGAASHALSTPGVWLVLVVVGALLLWWSTRSSGKRPASPKG